MTVLLARVDGLYLAQGVEHDLCAGGETAGEALFGVRRALAIEKLYARCFGRPVAGPALPEALALEGERVSV